MKILSRVALIVLLVWFTAKVIKITLFSPWRDALYTISADTSQRMDDAENLIKRGLKPDSEWMIGDSLVMVWLPRDCDRLADGNERTFFKAWVSFETPHTSIQVPCLERLRIRMGVDGPWTELCADSDESASTDGCIVSRYYETRLPKQFEPQEGTNAYVEVVVSAVAPGNCDEPPKRLVKTLSYEFEPDITSGTCEMLHLFCSQ